MLPCPECSPPPLPLPSLTRRGPEPSLGRCLLSERMIILLFSPLHLFLDLPSMACHAGSPFTCALLTFPFKYSYLSFLKNVSWFNKIVKRILPRGVLGRVPSTVKEGGHLARPELPCAASELGVKAPGESGGLEGAWLTLWANRGWLQLALPLPQSACWVPPY